MLFKKKPTPKVLYNLDIKQVFIFIGTVIDLENMENYLRDCNVMFSTVNSYYEIDLVESNTVLLYDRRGIHHMIEYGDCYRQGYFYFVLPNGKQLSDTVKLPNNMRAIPNNMSIFNTLIKNRVPKL